MKYISALIIGFAGGILAFFFAVKIYGLTSVREVKNTPSPTPTPIVQDFWQKIVNDESLSSVAIQSFQNGQLVRSGSGIVISSDGLVLTTGDMLDGEGTTYQISFQNQIVQGSVVAWDGTENLALLKSNAKDLSVSDFDQNYSFNAGQDILLAGKFISFSSPTVFSQRALISYVLPNDIVLDTVLSNLLSGAKVIDSDGQTVGVAYIRGGKIHVIDATKINNFIQSYFNTSH